MAFIVGPYQKEMAKFRRPCSAVEDGSFAYWPEKKKMKFKTRAKKPPASPKPDSAAQYSRSRYAWWKAETAL